MFINAFSALLPLSISRFWSTCSEDLYGPIGVWRYLAQKERRGIEQFTYPSYISEDLRFTIYHVR